MAINKIPNYNRIINLTLKTASGQNDITIKCPLRGRKPNIEINGTYTSSNYLPSFNITVENLYLDLSGEQYTEIEVEAGYEQETVFFTGTIYTIYQESPGPDGRTVIQCREGNLTNWLSSTVNINQKKGGALATVISQIAQSLQLMPDIKGTPAALVLPADFEFQGKASDAINRIINLFPTEALRIRQKGQTLACYSVTKKEILGVRQMKYLAAPPQMNAGDQDGSYYTTLSGPWVPGLEIGDCLEYPTWQIMKNFMQINTKTRSSKMIVTALQFQFSTVGGANQMTVQGYGL